MIYAIYVLSLHLSIITKLMASPQTNNSITTYWNVTPTLLGCHLFAKVSGYHIRVVQLY